LDHIFAQIIECSLSLEHQTNIGRSTAEYVILFKMYNLWFVRKYVRWVNV